MTQEEKELLLKEICGRLPYGVILRNVKCEFDIKNDYIPTNIVELTELICEYNVKPYLRLLSSMTEEEKTEFRRFISWQFDCDYQANTLIEVLNGNEIEADLIVDLLDWLNAHHFDYRGLIEKGLAIEAPADMYKLI